MWRRVIAGCLCPGVAAARTRGRAVHLTHADANGGSGKGPIIFTGAETRSDFKFLDLRSTSPWHFTTVIAFEAWRLYFRSHSLFISGANAKHIDRICNEGTES